MNIERPELLDALASRYVLGTMSGRARRAFERRGQASFALRRAVARWDNVLAPLSAVIAPVRPPAHVWERIAARAAPRRSRRSRLRPMAARLQTGWAAWLRPLLGFALGALFAVGAIELHPWSAPAPGADAIAAAAQPVGYLGILVDARGEAVLAISARRTGSMAVVKLLRPMAVPAGRIARLWALPSGGAAPIAVADVPRAGAAAMDLRIPAERRFDGIAKLGVSFESDRASTAPTQPFILSGHCVKFW